MLNDSEKTFLGNAGLEKRLSGICSGRWGKAEPGAPIGINLELPERRPLPKAVVLMGHASNCPCWCAGECLSFRSEHDRRRRPWGH
jgi:hypothetical protein